MILVRYRHQKPSRQDWAVRTASTMRRSESPGPAKSNRGASLAVGGDRIAVFSPACVLNFGVPVELGTNIVKLRSDAQGDTITTLTAKTCQYQLARQVSGSQCRREHL